MFVAFVGLKIRRDIVDWMECNLPSLRQRLARRTKSALMGKRHLFLKGFVGHSMYTLLTLFKFLIKSPDSRHPSSTLHQRGHHCCPDKCELKYEVSASFLQKKYLQQALNPTQPRTKGETEADATTLAALLCHGPRPDTKQS